MRLVAWALDALAYTSLAWYVVMWCICLFGLYRARVMFLKTPTRRWNRTVPEGDDDVKSLPDVSILRPLAGLDSNLYQNLCSTFTQDYPPHKYEIIFSVASPHDQAVPVAREVMARYAENGVQARLIIGDVSAGVNPKVNNLLRPYSSAKFDVLWVLDSQVRLGPGTLLASATHLASRPPSPSPRAFRKPTADRVGLVHHVPLGIDPSPHSWGSQVERAFLSTTHAKMYIAINSLAIESCVMGKSNLWRKSDLERVPDRFFAVNEDGARHGDGEGALGSEAFRLAYGQADPDEDLPDSRGQDNDDGPLESAASRDRILRRSRALGRFSIFLAEDNMLALSLWKQPPGLAHVLGSSPACIARTNVGDIKTLRDYIARRSRWIRVRRYMVPAATYAEPLTESVVVGLLALLALQRLGYTSGFVAASLLLACHFTAWFLVDVSVLGILELSADREQATSQPPAVEKQKRQAWLARTSAAFPSSRSFFVFVQSWALREVLAFPIWAYAMWGGNEVNWRGQPYRILSDSRAAQLAKGSPSTRSGSGRGQYEPLSTRAESP
ncbi:unnamed protein product [Parajaminaea phylloscopi]